MRHKPNPATQCQHRTKDRKQCQMPVAQTSAGPRQGAAEPLNSPLVAQTSVCVPLTSADSPAISNPAQLCPHHQRTAANQIYQSTKSNRPEKDPAQIAALATALLANTNNLSDPAQVNQFLANLLNQLAHNKISRKNAIAMAYISQLLLNSISVKHKQDRDAQLTQQAAAAAKPTQIVIDMPRPNYDSDSRSGESSDSHPVDFRTDESSDSHPVDVPLATPVPNHAPKNPPPPPSPDDEPPPSSHPQHTPLPRWGEQHFHNGTLSEPARPNTYGPPRMRTTRRRSPATLARLSGTANPGCARLMHRRNSAMDCRRACMRPWRFVRCRSVTPAFSLHLSCFA